MSRLPLFTIVGLLIGVGLGTGYWRHIQTGMPLSPGQEQTVWLVEAGIEFDALNQPVSVSLELPKSLPGFELVNEQAASPGYGFSVLDTANNRRGVWTKSIASGEQTLFYKAYFVPTSSTNSGDQDSSPPSTFRNLFLDESLRIAANQIVSDAESRSSSAQSFARELLKILLAEEPDQNAALLLAAEPLGELLVPLIQEAGYSARLSEGLLLEDARRRQRLEPWLEVFDGEWQFFNPRSGEQGLPENVLLWKRGGVSFLDVEGGTDSQLYFSMIRQATSAVSAARAQSSETGLDLFSISQLPIEEQSMFKLLLLLPLGALVVVLMRILVGIRTAGTFMPVLIAVAFLQTSLLPGLVSFIVVVAAGLLMRGYLSKLNMLLVARIATLVVIVVFMIALFSVLGAKLGLQTGMTVTFFPMIILAWTIERMSILWEEEGPSEVMIQGSGSLIVAIIAYLLMANPLMAHLSFNFPEIHLITLAIILLTGQYTGYRLSEFRRFRFWEKSSTNVH